jgi:hypothetical protein
MNAVVLVLVLAVIAIALVVRRGRTRRLGAQVDAIGGSDERHL